MGATVIPFSDVVELNGALSADDAGRMARALQRRPALTTASLKLPRTGKNVPLVWHAMEKNAPSVLAVLLKAGAPDRYVASEGCTAFQRAAAGHNEALVALFEAHRKGGPLSRAGSPGARHRTALAWAIEKLSPGPLPLFVDRWLADLATNPQPMDSDVGACLIKSAIHGASPSLLPRLVAAGVSPSTPPRVRELDPFVVLVREAEAARYGVPSNDAQRCATVDEWVDALVSAGAVFPTDIPWGKSREPVASALHARFRAASLAAGLPATPERPALRPRL